MSVLDSVTHGMEVIGADGVYVGTVDSVHNGRIKLMVEDSGEGHHHHHHHYIPAMYIAEIEGEKVRLSAVGAVAVLHEQEWSGKEKS